LIDPQAEEVIEEEGVIEEVIEEEGVKKGRENDQVFSLHQEFCKYNDQVFRCPIGSKILRFISINVCSRILLKENSKIICSQLIVRVKKLHNNLFADFPIK